MAGLNIRFMLDGLDSRPLLIYHLDEKAKRHYIHSRLLFWDPLAGHFEARLLSPTSRGPYPAVLNLVGHRESEKRFAAKSVIRALAKRGFLIITPKFRAFNCRTDEIEIATHLARNGFTLMGLRVYEALLMLKYLNHHPKVNPDRIGILGHSGGSTVSNLTVRLTNGFAAMVMDHKTDFRNRCWGKNFHCETVPRLFYFHTDINRLNTIEIPHLKITYGFRDVADRRKIIQFFMWHLTSAIDSG